jgi:hypothetical protein
MRYILSVINRAILDDTRVLLPLFFEPCPIATLLASAKVLLDVPFSHRRAVEKHFLATIFCYTFLITRRPNMRRALPF